MHLQTVEDLINALRGSGLFSPEQFEVIVRELAVYSDPVHVVKHLLRTERLTHYQFKKVLNGKATDLFVGPYVVTDRLGSGGMGRVYRAREPGGREVALKVIRSRLLSNPVVRGRCAREVQAAGTLNHPNIVHVFAAGEADGKVYMAMEFVDGIDLARLIHIYERLEVTEACEYIRQAALGLQHAHEHGFIHRDIKPSNIVVAGERHLPQATELAVVKILDLGLARAIDPEDMVAPDLTRDHTVVGTPDYMAPEQARNSKLVDSRADLYSLGCTFYYLLTGRVPFTVTNAIEKILAHQSELPPPVQAFRRDVPASVAALVAKLMAKRPEDRIQTAQEVVAALEEHVRYPAGTPPVAINPTRPLHDEHETQPTSTEAAERASAFSSAGNSSVNAITPLSLSPEELPEPPIPPSGTVAPSDKTPRPHNVPEKAPFAAPVASAKRRHLRFDTGALPQFIWVALALFGLLVLGLLLWLVSNP